MKFLNYVLPLVVALSSAPAFAGSLESAAVGAGAGVTAASVLPVAAGSALVATPAGVAAAASVGLTASEGITAVAANGLVPEAISAGYIVNQPLVTDTILGVSTSSLILSGAIGFGAIIIYQAITGELQPPTVSLLQEAYSEPSGKAFRFQK